MPSVTAGQAAKCGATPAKSVHCWVSGGGLVSLNRYAKQRDENEPEIVAALESIGCTVQRLDQPVDLLVGRGANNVLMEVKNPAKIPSQRRLTKAQKTFFKTWRGQVCKVETAEEAIEVVQRLTRKTAYPESDND